MRCTKPIWLEQYSLSVPCGKCIACRIARTSEWSVRLMNEAEVHDHSSFVTLTYRKENLPDDGSISKRELQLFLKRLRKQLEPRKIRFYACGEYGDPDRPQSIELGLTSGRPHYHLIIYGLAPSEHEFMSSYAQEARAIEGPVVDAWQGRGFVYVGTVTYNSVRYVAKYVQKKLYGQRAEEYEGRQPPFALMSKGLGKFYALANSHDIVERGGVYRQGKNVGIPRYYKKLYEDYAEGPDLKQRLEEQAQERKEEVRERLKFPVEIEDLETYEDFGVALGESQTQRGVHLKKKKELYGT